MIKYNFIPETPAPPTTNGHRTPPSSSRPHASGSRSSSSPFQPAPVRIDSTASMTSLNHNHSDPSTPDASSFNHPLIRGTATRSSPVASGSSSWPGLDPRLQVISDEPGEMVDDGTDTEVDVVVDVPLPIWTAPTHTVFPCFINHKIKWSAFIK